MKPGNPWRSHSEDIMEAFESYALAKQFGWTDDYILKLRTDNPDRYGIYTALLRGHGQSETQTE